MNEQEVMRLLKQEQANFALEAMKKPTNGTEFEYGFRCGVVTGLELAFNKIVEIFTKEKNDG